MLLGSTSIKVVRKTLMKLSPGAFPFAAAIARKYPDGLIRISCAGVNFTNISRAAFKYKKCFAKPLCSYNFGL